MLEWFKIVNNYTYKITELRIWEEIESALYSQIETQKEKNGIAQSV
jgi:hypothetical protein